MSSDMAPALFAGLIQQLGMPHLFEPKHGSASDRVSQLPDRQHQAILGVLNTVWAGWVLIAKHIRQPPCASYFPMFLCSIATLC